jgi:hypothetical protein
LASLDETFKNHKNASFIFFGDSHKHKNLKSLGRKIFSLSFFRKAKVWREKIFHCHFSEKPSLGRKKFSLSFFRKALPMMLSSQARMYL